RQLGLHEDEARAGDVGSADDPQRVRDGDRVVAQGDPDQEGGGHEQPEHQGALARVAGTVSAHPAHEPRTRGRRVGHCRAAHRRTARRASTISTGAPTTAVITPTWISPGGAMTRPRVSAAMTSAGPTSNEPSSRRPWSGPAKSR